MNDDKNNQAINDIKSENKVRHTYSQYTPLMFIK